MARLLRIQYPGAWYHVTCRGNERRDIFADDSDRCQFLDILTESCAIYGVEIHGYVLMTNHFHFVVHTPQANLNRFMHDHPLPDHTAVRSVRDFSLDMYIHMCIRRK